jgi:phage anti-repressor protein
MDFLDFLKTYSTVSNAFIDDFFGQYNLDEPEGYSIDLEVIVKWFRTKKEAIMTTLTTSYIKNKDYKVVSKKVNGTGRPRAKVMLTPRCFKKLAMQSRTKKSAEVREFYLDIEDLLKRYFIYIINGLQDKQVALLNNQKPKVNPQKGIIYILQAADGIGYYKLGSSDNLKKRLNAYNGDKLDDVQPLFLLETDNIKQVEKCVKTFMQEYQYRKYKEIYEVDLDMLKEMVHDCAVFSESVHIKKQFKRSIQRTGNYFMAIYKE